MQEDPWPSSGVCVGRRHEDLPAAATATPRAEYPRERPNLPHRPARRTLQQQVDRPPYQKFPRPHQPWDRFRVLHTVDVSWRRTGKIERNETSSLCMNVQELKRELADHGAIRTGRK